MADYSGYYGTYSTTFDPDPTKVWYWGSTKSFSGAETRVPKEYLGYLIDLLREYQLRNGKAEHVTIKLVGRTYVLEGLALSESAAKVRERFGWPNPCTHDDVMTHPSGYDVCMKCHEIFCEHTEQNLYRKGGVVIGGWTCSACGKETEPYG